MTAKQAIVRMKTDDVAEVLVYDQIGRDPWFGEGISAKEFRAQVKAIKAKTLNLRINSPGGSVIEGAAMLSALDEFKGDIEADVDGLSASAASVLMMGADVIRVASNALVMIHDPKAGVLGGAEDMRRLADLLDKVKGQALDAYERHSKAGRQQLADWMAAETWFTGEEAVEAGLAHEATAPVALAALAGHGALMARLGYKPPVTPADLLAAEETRKRKEIATLL
jgi:ATP-dependent protease ClpP protease subunit